MTFIFVGGTKNDFKNHDTLSEQQWRLFFFGGTIDKRDHNPPFNKISDELYNIHLPLFGTSSYAVHSSTYDAILNNRCLK